MSDWTGDDLLMMAGITPPPSEHYEANMDALAQEMAYGLGGGPMQPWWPLWLRLRLSRRPWLDPAYRPETREHPE